MMRKIFFGISILVVILGVIGCNDDDGGGDFKKGRQIYMSNRMAFQIVFPETQDTIIYNDTISGFTTWIQDNKLHLQNITVEKDSMILHDEKCGIRLEVSFKDTYLREEINEIRELGCEGEATIWIDSEKTVLKVSPVKGYVEKSNAMYLYSELLSKEKQPYIVMRSKGIRIKE